MRGIKRAAFSSLSPPPTAAAAPYSPPSIAPSLLFRSRFFFFCNLFLVSPSSWRSTSTRDRRAQSVLSESGRKLGAANKRADRNQGAALDRSVAHQSLFLFSLLSLSKSEIFTSTKLLGDEMFADSYPMREVEDGFFFEVDGSVRKREMIFAFDRRKNIAAARGFFFFFSLFFLSLSLSLFLNLHSLSSFSLTTTTTTKNKQTNSGRRSATSTSKARRSTAARAVSMARVSPRMTTVACMLRSRKGSAAERSSPAV